MKNKLGFVLLYIGILSQQYVTACSIFTCSKNGRVLVGANEDEYTSFHYMWFVPATKGKYGAVYFGKSDMQTQAGMNEHGLFFDFAAIPRIDSKDRKIDFISLAEVLSMCKNVDEALAMFRKHTYSSFSSQMLMADASGKSVLINADTIVHKTGFYQITTNFNICDLRKKNYDCLRYDKIDRALSGTTELSIPFFRNILDDVHQEGKVSTQYSNVYDLKNLKIHINWFHNYNETIVIDLKEELRKGFRMENLGDLFKDKTFAAHNFQESEDSYHYHMMVNEVQQKGPEAGISLFERFLNDHPDNADRIAEDFTWVPYALIAKARIAYDNLSFDYYYIPILNSYKMIWQSENPLLFRALDILHYIKTKGLAQNEFHFQEMMGYIHMVLGKKETSIGHYEKAIATVEKGSREEIRATNTLKKIKKTEFDQKKHKDLTYLKQISPSLTPEIFAPGLISKRGEYEFGSIFNKMGTEFFYGVNVNGKEEIHYSKLVGEHWSEPKTIFSHKEYGYNDPFLSPDENRLFFISQRALDGLNKKDDYDIWYAEKTKSGWSEPINVGPIINTNSNEYYISFTNDGTMYFSSNKSGDNFDIYRSKMVNGEFQDPISLDGAVNTSHYEADVFVDPSESYLIFCAIRPGGFGQGDLYISFKNTDGTWTESKNMGAVINSKGHELCPFVSKDGKFLFYTSNQDIYWVDASIIENYRD